MVKEVIWSPESENELSGILNYLITEWSIDIAKSLLDNVNEHIEKISLNPQLYPIIFRKGKFRKCVVTKHNSIIYVLNKETVYILRIFDTRQNPKKLKI